jgi:hypothetical protein
LENKDLGAGGEGKGAILDEKKLLAALAGVPVEIKENPGLPVHSLSIECGCCAVVLFARFGPGPDGKPWLIVEVPSARNVPEPIRLDPDLVRALLGALGGAGLERDAAEAPRPQEKPSPN